MSAFAFTGRAGEKGGTDDDLPLDESKMQQAMQMLAGEADKIKDDDPRQAVDFLRKLSDATGLELRAGMQEALQRMESGEDPEQIEAEMGDLLEAEDPFLMPGGKGRGKTDSLPPMQDETLYDL